MEPQYKSEEKFHHHVWNPDNEPNNLDNKFNDQVDWQNDEVKDEVSDRNVNYEEKVIYVQDYE